MDNRVCMLNWKEKIEAVTLNKKNMRQIQMVGPALGTSQTSSFYSER